jgi:isopenicillin N synthase-like dioxygenase
VSTGESNGSSMSLMSRNRDADVSNQNADNEQRTKPRRKIQDSRYSVRETMALPTVDLGPFLREEGVIVNDPPTVAQLSVSRKIDKCCRQHGFLHLTNFGLTDALRKQVFQASSDLFHQDDSHKREKLKRIKPSDNMGYSPVQSESINKSRPPELKEAFNVRFPPAHQNDFSGCPESFQSAVEVLQSVLKKAKQAYLTACALALDLPMDFFTQTLKEMNLCTIRFLHYPPCDFNETSEALDKPIRIGEHTDFGAVTFLLLGDNGAEGLQIKPVEGGEIGGTSGGEGEGWLDIHMPPGGVIVNTGALMARWTNDEWRATAHRVIVPSEQVASRERFSIAFFVDPDAGAIVDVHDRFLQEDGKSKRYEPITSLDYLMGKLKEMMMAK